MLNDPTGSCLPCGLHEPTRNNYFAGKFLTDRDFTDEQDYHRGHRHLHNSLLHGTGTVCGLKLIEHPSPGCRREFLVLEPGMGLDCCGREIVVPERALVPVAQLLAADPDLAESLDGTRHLVVGIEACDRGSEPVPAILPGCGQDGQPTDYGRIAEGYRLVLRAVADEQLAPADTTLAPRLSWVHTLNLDAQLPRAVHANEAENWLQLAVDADAGGSHLYLHGEPAHELLALIEGPQALSDTCSIRESRWLLAAGGGFADLPEDNAGGVGFWAADTVRADGARSGLLPVPAPLVRLAVSPGTGLLCVLALIDQDHATLSSYAPNQLTQWLAGGGAPQDAPEPLGTVEFDHGFGQQDSPAGRGAGMLRFSHDGRFLALAAPGQPGAQRCYLVDVSALNAGTLTQHLAVAAAVPAGTDVVGLDWSLDDSFLYLLGATGSPEEPGMELHRYARTGDGTELERRGHGVSLAGTARDLRIAPTETSAYLLLRDTAGITRLTTVDMERVKAVDPPQPEPVALSAEAIRIDGDGRSLELAGYGSRLYVAAGGQDNAVPPQRGLVAVIEIHEDDCSIHLDRQLDSCPGCAATASGCGCSAGGAELDPGRSVVLGHLANYVAADAPVMANEDTAVAGEVPIDNLTLRTLVPSAATLREIIACMLRRGIDVGPPGPRGDPGRDGSDGQDGADGADGKDGAGIDGATLEYREELSEPQVAIVDSGGQRILDIDLPAPRGAQAEAIGIVAASWVHGQEYRPRLGSFFEDMHKFGIALAFADPVTSKPLQVDVELGRNMIAYLQRRVDLNSGYVWANIERVEPVPLAVDPVIDGTLLTEWDLDRDIEQTPGFALLARDVGFEPGELLRVEFYADFLTGKEGRAVAGAHLAGQLPTGPGGPGGTFRSWFTVPQG